VNLVDRKSDSDTKFIGVPPARRHAQFPGTIKSSGIGMGWFGQPNHPNSFVPRLGPLFVFLALRAVPAIASGGNMYYPAFCVKSPRDINNFDFAVG
jgi:hypothetical protein